MVIRDLIKANNIRILGNLYNVKVEFSYKLLLISSVPLFLTAFLDLTLTGESLTNEINLQNIAIIMLVFCITSSLNEYKTISYFTKKYVKPNFMTIFYISFQSIIMFYLFFSFKKYLIFAILGGFFWFSSGILRGILQLSKALFEEHPLKLVRLAQIYSFLRSSYYFLGVVLLMSVVDYRQLQTELLSLLINKSFFWKVIILFINIAYLLIPSLIFFFCIYNLYPYLTKSHDIQTSIEIIQFISSNKEGYRFNEISSKFNNIKEGTLKDYLDRLIYVKYLIKNGTKYNLMPHYILILQGKI